MRPRVALLTIVLVLAGASVIWLSLRSRAGAEVDRAGDPAGSGASEVGAVELRAPVPDSPLELQATRDEPMLAAPEAAPAARQVAKSRAPERLPLAGRVLFPPGLPADEHVVVVARTGHKKPDDAVRCTPAADGSFRFDARPRREFTTLVLEARYLYLRLQVKVLPGLHSGPLELRPLLGGVIRANVSVPPGRERGTLAIDLSGREHREVDAGTEVSFEIEHLRAGAYTLDARQAGFPALSLPVHVEPGAITDVELVFRTGASLEGTVRDERGRPLEGIEVEAWSRRADGGGASVGTGTDENGLFCIEALAPGDVTLRVRDWNHARQELALGVLGDGTERSGIEIVLSPGNTLAGRIVTNGGGALFAEVGIQDEKSGERFDFDLLVQEGTEQDLEDTGLEVLGPDGRFEFRGLSEGPFRVELDYRRGGALVRHVPAGTSDLVLEPVRKAPLEVLPRAHDGRELRLVTVAVWDGEGLRETWLPGIRIERVLPGPVWLEVTNGTDLCGWRSVDVAPGAKASVEVVLLPATSVEIEVMDRSGKPIEVPLELQTPRGVRRLFEGHGSPCLAPGTYRLRAEDGNRTKEVEFTLSGEPRHPVRIAFD